jgi:hypothetical protein
VAAQVVHLLHPAEGDASRIGTPAQLHFRTLRFTRPQISDVWMPMDSFKEKQALDDRLARGDAPWQVRQARGGDAEPAVA